jgi:hypothetical protein
VVGAARAHASGHVPAGPFRQVLKGFTAADKPCRAHPKLVFKNPKISVKMYVFMM